MQQGVHGLSRHDAVFRELFVAFRLPVDGKSFEVALGVGAVLLDQVENFFGPVKCSLLAGQAVVCRQRIDGKALIVGVLGGVQRFAGVVTAPVHTAVFHIVTVLREKLVGVAGIVGQIVALQDHGRF